MKIFNFSRKNLFLCMFLFAIFSTFSNAQVAKEKDPQLELQRKIFLLNFLNIVASQTHYAYTSPDIIDDVFSETAFNEFIDFTDYSKKFLIADDLKYLQRYKYNIDDQIKSPKTSPIKFYLDTYEIYKQREKMIKGFYEKILSKPFNIYKKEYIDLDYEKMSFAKDTNELKDYWRKYLKYNTIVKMASLKETDESRKEEDTTNSYVLKSIDSLEREARKNTLKNVKEWYKRTKKEKENKWFNNYLNILTERFDPHSNYFGPKVQKAFNQRMSGKLEGIGARLREKNGYVEVAEILIGSPCWKQGELEVGDKIIEVAQKSQHAVNIVDMPVDDAIELIKGKKGTEVTLTVKKTDGLKKKIKIIRDVIEMEETFVKSAVIIHNNKKYGLINLPKFYVDLKKTINTHDCSDDVKKEIEKLKESNVEGIIMDLRNNGGGSLQEAVEIVGHFIPQGPVVQVKENNSPPYVLTDDDKEQIWTGPLVVLVSKFSASASEIFSAAIQDYDRGIILGSDMTFGKGTVQTIIDLDEKLPKRFDKIKPLGAFKMTIQKFYRISGGSTQLRGVSSDVLMPDRYLYTEIGERDYKDALKWDSIVVSDYKKFTFKNKSKIIENSQKRVANSEYFKTIDKKAWWLKIQKDKNQFPLEFNNFLEEEKRIEKENKVFSNLGKMKTEIDASSTISEKKILEGNKSLKDKKEKWLNQLKKDFYIEEGVSVIEDILELSK